MNIPIMDNSEQLVARTREDLEPNKGSRNISANQQVVRLCQRAISPTLRHYVEILASSTCLTDDLT
jgi:hypothetical protein